MTSTHTFARRLPRGSFVAGGWRFGAVSLMPPHMHDYFSSPLGGDGQGVHSAALRPKSAGPPRVTARGPVRPRRTPDPPGRDAPSDRCEVTAVDEQVGTEEHSRVPRCAR